MGGLTSQQPSVRPGHTASSPPAATRGSWLVSAATAAALAATFFVLVTANGGGYRYGTSDQAFYIPAIRAALTPELFPRDLALVAPQARLLLLDELAAALIRLTGLSLDVLFLASYVVTALVFVAGVSSLGRRLYATAAGTWALTLALTLRHRIAATGVNTYEPYFHPRVLAFGLGLLGLGFVWRRQSGPAWAMVLLAFLIHPTTALWFALWIAAGVLLSPVRPQHALGAAVGTMAIAAWLLSAGPLRGALHVMDPPWLAAFASKDYLFPTDWRAGVWATNALAPIVVALVYAWRRHLGVAGEGEQRVVVGALAVVATFLASLPFIAADIALAVQLQTSRVLWPVETLATAYLVWALLEGRSRREARPAHAWRTALVVGVLATAAVGRGAFVLRVEHERPLISPTLDATSAWQRTATWVRGHTAPDAHFLVSPSHAWKYGTSFRVAAERDVFLEEVKDAAMATYAREVALRVVERTQALGDFGTLSPDRAVTLARTYDLDFLIAEHEFPFELVLVEPPFRVYALHRGARGR